MSWDVDQGVAPEEGVWLARDGGSCGGGGFGHPPVSKSRALTRGLFQGSFGAPQWCSGVSR